MEPFSAFLIGIFLQFDWSVVNPGIKGSPDLFYRIQGQRRSPAISAEPGPVFYHNNVSMVWPAGLLGGLVLRPSKTGVYFWDCSGLLW